MLYHLAVSIIIVLMMEAASTSKIISVNFYQTTRRNNPEDSHLHELLSASQKHSAVRP
jgi:hypothetical protein